MSVLSLPLAKTHLNITREVNDSELQAIIDGAEAIIANYVGPLAVGGSSTVRVTGATRTLILPTSPIGAVTAIATPTGTTVDLTTVTVNQAAGLVYFNDDISAFCNDVYDVTFTSGWATVPADLMLAIKEMVRHLWATQRGGGTRANSPSQPDAAPGYLLPYRVEQLVEPYRRIGIGAA